jgi:putative membrane protein
VEEFIMKKITTLLLATCGSGLIAYAQSQVSSADRMFMNKAAQGGMAEVKLGQLASEKASAQPVKDFGMRMVNDHSQANDKLKGIASSKGVTLPDSVSPKDKALYDRLSGLSGDSFDRAYMQAMVKDHNEDVAEFRKESKMAKDSDVQSFASMTLPTLEDHLRMAKDTASKLGASAQR